MQNPAVLCAPLAPPKIEQPDQGRIVRTHRAENICQCTRLAVDPEHRRQVPVSPLSGLPLSFSFAPGAMKTKAMGCYTDSVRLRQERTDDELRSIDCVQPYAEVPNPSARASNTSRILRDVRSSRCDTSQMGKRTGATSSRTRTTPGVSRAISSIVTPMPIP